MPRETELHDIAELDEMVVLVGIDRDDGAMGESLLELRELCRTAGAVVVGELTQKRDRPHPAHYIGKGKLDELKTAIAAYDATGIVCDDELSPAQLRNLEKLLETKVMDRTMVILDIFASRAVSAEGKIQVELAQLKYRLTRLTGMGVQLSRLGGGIGTRGPGEKKLESDRRYIKERIAELTAGLKSIETHRQLLRSSRGKKGRPVAALVGYTNAGKSTLINRLTDAGVLAEDKLFATLDTTTRSVGLPNGSEILLTDTVGFIRKLPHQLVQAFRATLEELKYADILIHVVDASSPSRDAHMEVVYSTLRDLGCGETPVITVYNKTDRDIELPLPADKNSMLSVKISALEGGGLDLMLEEIEKLLKSFRKEYEYLIPYKEGHLLGFIRGKCEIMSETHTAEGYSLKAFVTDEIKGILSDYEIK